MIAVRTSRFRRISLMGVALLAAILLSFGVFGSLSTSFALADPVEGQPEAQESAQADAASAGISIDSAASAQTWSAGSGTVQYIPAQGGASARLVLNNAQIDAESASGVAIEFANKTALVVQVTGNSSISGARGLSLSNAAVSFEGSGSVAFEGNAGSGIFGQGDSSVLVDGPTVSAVSYSAAALDCPEVRVASGALKVNGGAQTYQAMTCDKLQVTGGSLMASGGTSASAIQLREGGSLILSGGEIEAKGAREASGLVLSGTAVVTGGTLRASGDFGINVTPTGHLSAEGGSIVVQGDSLGLRLFDSSAFDSGSNGGAYVQVNSAAPSSDLPSFTSGILVVGKTGTVRGQDVTLAADVTVPSGTALTIPAGTTLTVPADRTLVNDGSLTVRGSLVNRGIVEGSGDLTNNGLIDNQGTIQMSFGEYIDGSGVFAGDPPTVTVPSDWDEGIFVRGDNAAVRYIVTNPDGSTGSIVATPATAGEPFTIVLDNVTIASGEREVGLHVGGVGDEPARIVLKGNSSLSGSVGLELNVAAVAIEGDGSLATHGQQAIVMYDVTGGDTPGPLTIKSGTVKAQGIVGIAGGQIACEGGTLVAEGKPVDGLGEGFAAGIRAHSISGTGNAFVVLNSAVNRDTSEPLPLEGFTSGVLIVGDSGQLHGDSVTLNTDADVPEGATVLVPEGSTLTVPEGVTLTNDGTINLDGAIVVEGTLVNNGIINVRDGARFDVARGVLVNNGRINGWTPPADEPDSEGGDASEGDAGEPDKGGSGSEPSGNEAADEGADAAAALPQTGDTSVADFTALAITAISAAVALALSACRLRSFRTYRRY